MSYRGPFGSHARSTPRQSSSGNGNSEPPAKRTRFDFGEDVTILVGAAEKRYSVHKKIVCSSSDFFRAACNGDWKEGKEGIVRLPEVDPATFEIYICWLYTNEIDVVSEATDSELRAKKYEKSMTGEAYGEIAVRIINAFALGDMLQDVTFKNTLVDEFTTFVLDSAKVPNTALVGALFDTVPHDSTLTKVIIDIVATRCQKPTFEKQAEYYPPAFVLSLAKASIRDRDMSLGQRDPANRSMCFYHEHDVAKAKGKTKWCD